MLMAGYGMGSYDVETERLDLGTGNTTITGTSEADVDYFHSCSKNYRRQIYIYAEGSI